ncbi:hypothetical protein N0V83_004318 [Neocucurbitaria cava]|uniref:Uncharacterized protein n=1 Tax=Neocucurbitaria cava TaxID=798079 RepID=A0A9W9CN23_9PLEO|nr:hypothetical protein N0V83_004318 [Neocucurbitaria cava]
MSTSALLAPLAENASGFGQENRSPRRSGLKLRLRCIQSALRGTPEAAGSPGFNSIAGRKRTAAEVVPDDGDDTDSDIELFPTMPRGHKAPRRPTIANGMKRNARIVDVNNPEHTMLIAGAIKVGVDYYNSDAEDLPGDVKDTNKPHLFRNVNWGTRATDFSNDADFSNEPEFRQFVPGRFEILPDGTVADQKAKLIVKLTDKNGAKRIFTNPPPRDWKNQDAITALNKRAVQQIRRNTNVRFREVVQAYVPEERRWILANLTNGKPTKGWKTFVKEFNEAFAGKVLRGMEAARPVRSHSSLTKEVERFGPDWYSKGLVPVPTKKGRKE